MTLPIRRINWKDWSARTNQWLEETVIQGIEEKKELWKKTENSRQRNIENIENIEKGNIIASVGRRMSQGRKSNKLCQMKVES